MVGRGGKSLPCRPETIDWQFQFLSFTTAPALTDSRERPNEACSYYTIAYEHKASEKPRAPVRSRVSTRSAWISPCTFSPRSRRTPFRRPESESPASSRSEARTYVNSEV